MDEILIDNFPTPPELREENFSQTIEMRLVRGSYPYDPEIDYRNVKNCATFAQLLALLPYEKLLILFLNVNGRLIGTQDFNGDVEGAPFYSQTVLKAALLCNAVNVIAIHNHPSVYIDGDLKFSEQDIKAYDILKIILKFVQINLIDSVLISGDRFTSYKMQQAEAERLKNLNAYDRGELAAISHHIDEAGKD